MTEAVTTVTGVTWLKAAKPTLANVILPADLDPRIDEELFIGQCGGRVTRVRGLDDEVSLTCHVEFDTMAGALKWRARAGQ